MVNSIPDNKEIVLGSDDPKNRDLSMIKVCSFCGQKYHPRKNSYQAISKFCSQVCMRKDRKKRLPGHNR